jgi:hypothetical protein
MWDVPDIADVADVANVPDVVISLISLISLMLMSLMSLMSLTSRMSRTPRMHADAANAGDRFADALYFDFVTSFAPFTARNREFPGVQVICCAGEPKVLDTRNVRFLERFRDVTKSN